ncbi:type I DNA topoisomerase [Chlamydia gallinacea]|uniref:DNA topoisomerase 1 n=2 Tax=Chlamydia gallinacea TaxID=1457153 RepID=A0A173DYS4_9CHLA|nr:type I DNA topoisomerase [Chlamydia gallinacea]EYE60637.1 DNA topoisomerase I [Bacteroides fragilis str. S6L5]ANG66053.1 DNA topoisomerase I [Chlamydia gallinacea 08-1274/3]AQT77722.1 DNA topoisomerase I [Chlamydia gallinacea]MBX6680037.1 type I DNA topoisomerase [Chlamydia gallinacea]MBX6687269.1 type I DNA topoisomerase [Chlamydia gallinacea]
MKKSLIVVESPAKIKTLQKLLGKSFIFASSLGHVVDLPAKEFGIDINHDFEPIYRVLPDKQEVINHIRKLAESCDVVYLSPDPDREGEAIAWHIAQQLPKHTKIQRIAFNAITKNAVTEALKHPRPIDMALVNAQQARRLLDRIVGYKISPILSRKLQQRSGISAGRVQSVALKLVVDREKAIETFIPTEYWNIRVLLQDALTEKTFWAHLYAADGKKWEKELPKGKNPEEILLINSKEKAEYYVQRLENASYRVTRVEAKEKRRHASPPFITSTLQQEASRHFRFSSSRTMSIAQTLYEGVELDNEDATGLITYMRTDSTRTDPEALATVRNYIQTTFGLEYLPQAPNLFSTKKMTQDAHEAIRPTDIRLSPDKLQNKLSDEQFKLYSLIWKRFVASQMNPAIYDTLTLTISTNEKIDLRASGSVLKFRGFLVVYEEKHDDDPSQEDNPLLPQLHAQDILEKIQVTAEQAFTKPLPRFTEASLIKELEKSGIGRPSTYATIMNKIQNREYTIKENQRLHPTELGKIISQFLETNFPNIMDIGFTAFMEDELELIADNKKSWKLLLKEFWDQFFPVVTKVEKEAVIPRIVTDIPCSACHKGKLVKIWAKNRYFYGCSEYPECDFKTSEEELTFNKDDYAEATAWDSPCPVCHGPMKIRHGRFGTFLGCLNYPKCRGTITLHKKGEEIEEEEAIPCPAIGCSGKILKKRSRYNKTFYSCSEYPNCSVIGNTIDAVISKYTGTEKTPYEKKTTKKKTLEKNNKNKAKNTTKKKKETSSRKGSLLRPSPELAQILGEEPITRGEATKKIWEYIKKSHLQDPMNKKRLIPDDKLQKIIGSEPIDMFQLPKLLSEHLLKINES